MDEPMMVNQLELYLISSMWDTACSLEDLSEVMHGRDGW